MNASIKAVSEPVLMALKFSLFASIIFSPIVVYPGGPSSHAPFPSDSEVLNRSAYLFKFLESKMSGYSSAIHFGTYIPIRPS